MSYPAHTVYPFLADRKVVVSPGWLIHAAVRTKYYAFCWGMGGENRAYYDMYAAAMARLR